MAFIKRIILRFIQLQRVVRFFLFDSLVLKNVVQRKPKSLLVIQIEGIGDYILFRNFFEAVKTSNRFADYSITFCGSQAYRSIAETIDASVVSEFIWIDSSAFKKHANYRRSILSDIRKRGFEVVMNPVYSRDSILEDSVVRVSGATTTIGFRGDDIHAKPWERNIVNRYYTELIANPVDTVFEFCRTKFFFEAVLQTTISIDKPSLPKMSFDSFVKYLNYAVLCPGAVVAKRRWRLKNFLQTAEYLHAQYNMASILVGGPQDQPSQNDLKEIEQRPYITNLIGKISLCQTIALIQKSQLVVSNDTGISHIGVAADVPVVVVSTGNHYGRFTEYPPEVYSKIFYAYPPEMNQSRRSLEELVEEFRDGSTLNINSILPKTIVSLIQKVLR
ncbi:MAG TPA: glycosyltransferase family 9 protein [Bacteroidota bacterium]|nr:glycosyltransferase family 9 protein [Bacteroidota bacterium]